MTVIMTNAKNRSGLTVLLLLAPVTLVLVLTLILPSVWALVLSFFQYKLGQSMRFIGLENYLSTLADIEGFWFSVARTMVFTGLIILGEFIIGVLFALLLAGRFRLQKLWVALVIAPMAVSPIVAIIVWRYMLSPNYGMINYLLSLAGLVEPNWFVSSFFAFLALVMIDLWLEVPFVFTMVYPAIISISPTLFEAAKMDGADYVRTQLHITFPLIRPILITTLVFRLIFALRIFEPVWLFAKGGPAGATKVFAIHLYEQAFVYWRFGAGSAIAWILLILTLAVSLPQIRLMRRTMFGGGRSA
jgi:multiple sugar transport system permease protein